MNGLFSNAPKEVVEAERAKEKDYLREANGCQRTNRKFAYYSIKAGNTTYSE